MDSPFNQTKRLEAEVRTTLRAVDVRALALKQRTVLEELLQNLDSAKIYTKNWELSETETEQEQNARWARKWLSRAQRNILNASQFDVFGPADVAHLSAQIDHLKDQISKEF